MGHRKNHFIYELIAAITFGGTLPGRRFASSGSDEVPEMADFSEEDNGDDEEDIIGDMSQLRDTPNTNRNVMTWEFILGYGGACDSFLARGPNMGDTGLLIGELYFVCKRRFLI